MIISSSSSYECGYFHIWGCDIIFWDIWDIVGIFALTSPGVRGNASGVPTSDGDRFCTQEHVLTRSEAREPSLLVRGVSKITLGYPQMSSAKGQRKESKTAFLPLPLAEPHFGIQMYPNAILGTPRTKRDGSRASE